MLFKKFEQFVVVCHSENKIENENKKRINAIKMSTISDPDIQPKRPMKNATIEYLR